MASHKQHLPWQRSALNVQNGKPQTIIATGLTKALQQNRRVVIKLAKQTQARIALARIALARQHAQFLRNPCAYTYAIFPMLAKPYMAVGGPREKRC